MPPLLLCRGSAVRWSSCGVFNTKGTKGTKDTKDARVGPGHVSFRVGTDHCHRFFWVGGTPKITAERPARSGMRGGLVRLGVLRALRALRVKRASDPDRAQSPKPISPGSTRDSDRRPCPQTIPIRQPVRLAQRLHRHAVALRQTSERLAA